MKDIPFKRLLLLSPSFAPFANAEAIVNNKLALCFMDKGIDVEIISKYLIGQSDYDYGSNWEEAWMPLKPKTHIIDYRNGKTERILGTFKSLFIFRNLIEGNRWAYHAYQKASELHSKKPFDLILSRAFPLSAHLPALKLKTKNNIPWIANWNDPWEFLRDKNKQGLSLPNGIGRKESMVANSIAKTADWHTFPSEQLKDVMASSFHSNIGNVSTVIPHAVLPNYRKIISVPNTDAFTISYLGRLSSNQNPIKFLEVIAGLMNQGNNIIFKFYGIDDLNLAELANRTGLGPSISINPPIPYLDSLRVMSESDLLLIIDPEDLDGIILTSKVADYIQADRPILALTNSNGTLAKLFRNRECVFSVPFNDQDGISKLLKNLIQQKGSGTEFTVDPILKSYFSPEYIMDLYSEIYYRIKNSVC